MNQECKPIYGMINIREERELARASFGYINGDIEDIRKNFIKLGFHLAECKDMKYYEDFGYNDFYEFVEKNFYMDKSTVSRYINIFMKFSAVSGEYQNNHKMWLDDKYEKYTYSQLSEMLPMSEEQMKQVKPEMTVAEIRALKKSWKSKDKSCDVATEEKCRLDGSYICCIENIQKKHFLKGGNVEGCAGCCNGCLNKESCEYCCDYARKRIEVVAEAEYKEIEEESVVQCRYDNTYICPGTVEKECPVCCKKCSEINECEKKCEYMNFEMAKVPELPILKNMEEREKFVLGFKEWNIWCQNELTEETYYRFDLPDGAAIVVRSYPVYLEWKKEEIEGKELFLLKPGYKHFKNCETNMTVIKNYLKDLQKNKK